jgi:hypothetical protein
MNEYIINIEIHNSRIIMIIQYKQIFWLNKNQGFTYGINR